MTGETQAGPTTEWIQKHECAENTVNLNLGVSMFLYPNNKYCFVAIKPPLAGKTGELALVERYIKPINGYMILESSSSLSITLWVKLRFFDPWYTFTLRIL